MLGMSRTWNPLIEVAPASCIRSKASPYPLSLREGGTAAVRHVRGRERLLVECPIDFEWL
jgi:hypothetical protein